MTLDNYQQVLKIEPASAQEVQLLEAQLDEINNEILKLESEQDSEQLSQMLLIQSELEGLKTFKTQYLKALQVATERTESDPFASNNEAFIGVQVLQEIQSTLQERINKSLLE